MKITKKINSAKLGLNQHAEKCNLGLGPDILIR